MDNNPLEIELSEILLEKFGIEESKRLSRYLLEDLKEALKLHPNKTREILHDAASRLLKGEPLQYITQIAHFYGYKYYVDKAVLIPRPETEELVYQVLRYIKSKQDFKPKILDIGTGSGCIPITIKKENNNCSITAYDISKDALKVATHNANQHGVDIVFEDCNILSNQLSNPVETFDIIISNPPYIPISEREIMGSSVIDHEPQIALFTDDEHGLVFYKKIAMLCENWLVNGGVVFLELNEFHSEKIKEIYSSHGLFSSVEIIDDMQGKPRMLKALRGAG